MNKKFEYIPIYGDIIFKNLFGVNSNKKFVINLLESLFDLEEDTLKDSEILNSVKLNKEVVLNKLFELDVVVKTTNGLIYDLEMQKTLDIDSEIKNLIYISGLLYKDLKPGEKYNKINKMTQIEFIKRVNTHKLTNMINKYYLTNEKDANDKILPEYFNIMIIDIDGKLNKEYNQNKEIESWIKLIRAESIEEAKKAATTKILKEALKESVRFMQKDYVQDYSAHERLIESRMDTMKKEGIRERSYEIAKNLMNNTNIPLEQISLCTGISVEELKKLSQDNK